MQKWIIRKLGGYPTIEEALVAAPEKTLNEAVAKLYCFVTKDDILKKQGNYYTFKGNELTVEELKQLIQEAKLIRSLRLWKVLKTELNYQASQRLYFDSQTVEDLTWAKLLIFTADIIETKLKTLEKLDGTV